MSEKKDHSLAASVAAGSEIPERGESQHTPRPWTIDELVEIAKTAIDDAHDVAEGESPIPFKHELDFQLNAPEHRGRPALTRVQKAVIRAIWNADARTSHPSPAAQPEFKEQGFPWR